MNVFVIIPAFNEEKVIGKVIKNLRKYGYKNIIVVDDCSTDRTALRVIKAKGKLLWHRKNKGQGAALRTGINYALLEGADIIVTFDADGQHCAKDIKTLIKPISQGKVDVVLGSRFKKSKIPFAKKCVLKAGVEFCNCLYGLELTDTHNGIRVLSRYAAEKIKITENRMEHASEILEKIAKYKLRYCEVPVTIKYTKYSMAKGQSIFNSANILKNMVMRKLRNCV